MKLHCRQEALASPGFWYNPSPVHRRQRPFLSLFLLCFLQSGRAKLLKNLQEESPSSAFYFRTGSNGDLGGVNKPSSVFRWALLPGEVSGLETAFTEQGFVWVICRLCFPKAQALLPSSPIATRTAYAPSASMLPPTSAVMLDSYTASEGDLTGSSPQGPLSGLDSFLPCLKRPRLYMFSM